MAVDTGDQLTVTVPLELQVAESPVGAGGRVVEGGGGGGGVGVGVGEGTPPYSYAPMSYAEPTGRVTPSKSFTTSGERFTPWLIAGEVERRWKSPEEGFTKLGLAFDVQTAPPPE